MQPKDYRSAYDRGDEIEQDPSKAAKDIMLVRLGSDQNEISIRVAPEERVERDGDVEPVVGVGPERCCSDDDLCPSCRKSVRDEAAAWLHELSVSHRMHWGSANF